MKFYFFVIITLLLIIVIDYIIFNNKKKDFFTATLYQNYYEVELFDGTKFIASTCDHFDSWFGPVYKTLSDEEMVMSKESNLYRWESVKRFRPTKREVFREVKYYYHNNEYHEID